MNFNIENNLDRLLKVLDADLGLYVLGLFSFIEGYLKDKYQIPNEESLRDILNTTKYFTNNDIIYGIQKSYFHTNRVRHNFFTVHEEVARSATYFFTEALKKELKIASATIDKFVLIYKNWDNKNFKSTTSVIENYKEIINRYKNKEKDLLSELEIYKQNVEEINRLKFQIKEKDYRLRDLEESLKNEKEKRNNDFEIIKSEKENLQKQLKDNINEISKYKNIEEYINFVSEFSFISKTRRDFEATYSKLTVEQEECIKKIFNGKDGFYSIKGTSGSGKTLVLLQLFKKYFEDKSLYKDNVYIITYNRSLNKFNKYILEKIGIKDSENFVFTVDKFIYEKIFKKIYDEGKIVYSPADLIKSLNISDNEKELFEKNCEKYYRKEQEEYEDVDSKISSNKEDYGLTNLFNKIEREMEEKKVYYKDYIYKKISEIIDQTKIDLFEIDCILLDEAQDLDDLSLNILKKIFRSKFIFAFDIDQMIYRKSIFKNNEIDFRGHSFLLKDSLRSTIPILNLANCFRGKYLDNCEKDYRPDDDEKAPKSYRDGAFPEIFFIKDNIREAIEKKIKFYIENINYEPNNICVLTLDNKQEKTLLEKIKYQFTKINNETDLDFSENKNIFLSTIHSGKGLEFPVVIIYIRYIPEGFDDKKLQNLLYVAMTRAMDNLTIFISEELINKNKVISNLKDAYDELLNK